MREPKRIGISLLDDDLKTMINASAKIFPLSTYEELPAAKIQDYYKILTGSHKNEIYTWDDTAVRYVLIGADDQDIDWSVVKNKPTTFPPAQHNHDSSYAALNHNHDAAYAPIGHNHDSQYAVKAVESNVGDHESRLQYIEGGYSSAHMHTNKAVLDSLSYSGAKQSIDLKSIEDNAAAVANKADSTTLSGHTGNSTIHVTQPDKDNWNGKQAALGFTPENMSNKGAANGYASLGSDGKVPAGQLPALGGSGDMTKSVYDPDGDGKVSSAVNADAIPWTGVSGRPAVETHMSDTTVHVNATEKNTWNGKVDSTTLSGHTGNTTVHVTQTDKDLWNTVGSKADASDSVKGTMRITASTAAPASPVVDDLWIDLN